MDFNGLVFLILALICAAVAGLYHQRRSRPISDEQLREWLSFIRKPNGRSSSERLLSHEYDYIRPLFHPALKAEFEEKLTRLTNEYSARAIETTLVFRRQANGLPLASHDDAILIREGLRKEKNGGNGSEFTENNGSENEALPGDLATFRRDASVRSSDSA